VKSLLLLLSLFLPGTLDTQIHNAIQNFPGQVTLYAKNLNTGATYSIRPDDPVPTASTIKLPIMVELFAEAAEGKLDWNQKLELKEQDKVPGSGILNEFSAGDTFPIRDLMHVMIVMSDNTATNLLLDRIGGDAVNRRMDQLGLKQTAVMRKIMRHNDSTEEGRKPGNEQWGTGRSSPHDMVVLMEKLYRGQLVDKQSSDEMLTVMKRQRDLQGVGRDMPDTVVASKSGALDHLRSEVALVYSPRGPIAIAITVQGIPKVDYGVDNAGNLLIATVSQILIDQL
jgi:beta-lactamase class A